MTKLEEFLKQYNKAPTIKSFKWTLGTFAIVIYGDKKNLGEKMDQYLSEKRDHQKDIETFHTAIANKPPLSKKLMFSNIKTFLEDSEIELPKKFWKKIKNKNKSKRAVTLDEVPEIKQLKQIFTHLDLKGKALFMILESSGMRIGEALQLNLQDIDMTNEPTKIRIRSETTKTGTSRFAYISSEATEILQEWLRYREDSLDIIMARSNRIRIKKIDENRIFPFEIATAIYIWNNALKKAKLNKRDGTTKIHVFHPHVLRKFFRTQMTTEIPVDIVEALMGHEGYLTEVYRRYTCKQLGEFYLKGEHKVLIFKDVAKITRLKQEMDKTKLEIEQHNRSLRIQIDNVRAENIEQKNQISKLKCDIDCNRAYIQDLIEQVHDLNTAYSQIASYQENEEIIAENSVPKKPL